MSARPIYFGARLRRRIGKAFRNDCTEDLQCFTLPKNRL